MDLEKIEGLVKIIEDSSLNEFTYKDKDVKITMSKLDHPPVVAAGVPVAASAPVNTTVEKAEEEEEDPFADILKEVQTENEDVIYAMVEDDVELNAISKVFAEILDDVDIEM